MRFLLCAATELEIEATLSFLNNHPEYKTKMDVLITGVGLTAATYQLTKKILSYSSTIPVITVSNHINDPQ